jgi:hypothetical protein
MEKKFVYITYSVWQTIPEVLQRILITRIFQRYHFCPSPIGRMPEIENSKCIRKDSTSKWDKYRISATTFKDIPGFKFGYLPHHIVYFYFFGDPKGLQIQHKCGCPDCIEPTHLMLDVSGENLRHASLTRKPDDINEGLKSWKTWPGDHMIMVHMRKILGLNYRQIGKVINLSGRGVNAHLIRIYKRGTVFINKKWAKKYTPPAPMELMGWIKIILIRIKKDPELRSLFSLKDLQQMFSLTVDFDRTIAWYSMTMKKF